MKSTIDNKILSELLNRAGWVSTTRLGRISNCYAVHSSISRLRKRNYEIESKRSNDPQKKGWFKLV